jgi:hypothetical protein
MDVSDTACILLQALGMESCMIGIMAKLRIQSCEMRASLRDALWAFLPLLVE